MTAIKPQKLASIPCSTFCAPREGPIVRSSTKDQTVTLKKARIMTLEESLEYLSDDEYLEVTPESIRLRKKELDKAAREKAARKAKYSEE